MGVGFSAACSTAVRRLLFNHFCWVLFYLSISRHFNLFRDSQFIYCSCYFCRRGLALIFPVETWDLITISWLTLTDYLLCPIFVAMKSVNSLFRFNYIPLNGSKCRCILNADAFATYVLENELVDCIYIFSVSVEYCLRDQHLYLSLCLCWRRPTVTEYNYGNERIDAYFMAVTDILLIFWLCIILCYCSILMKKISILNDINFKMGSKITIIKTRIHQSIQLTGRESTICDYQKKLLNNVRYLTIYATQIRK